MEARTGEQGVALAHGQPPDLILMDLGLPGMDGTEALHLLRAARAHGARAGGRRDGVRDGGGPGAGAVNAGFDGYLDQTAGACCALPGQVRGYLARGEADADDRRR